MQTDRVVLQAQINPSALLGPNNWSVVAEELDGSEEEECDQRKEEEKLSEQDFDGK